MVTDCYSCGRKAKIKLSYRRDYCQECFDNMIEKRVKKDLRNRKIIKNNTINIKKDNTSEYYVAIWLLKRIFGEHIKIQDKKGVVPTNADIEASKNLETYLKNENKKSQQTILQNVLKEEIDIICEHYKFPKTKSEINKLLETVEKEQPGAKFALIK